MENGDVEGCGRRMLRKTKYLVCASFLPCALGMQHAAALSFNEKATDGLRSTDYRRFAEDDSFKASAPWQLADEKKLVWSFRAGYMIVMGMSNSTDDKLLQIFLESGPQIFLERGKVPHISVRIERQF